MRILILLVIEILLPLWRGFETVAPGGEWGIVSGSCGNFYFSLAFSAVTKRNNLAVLSNNEATILFTNKIFYHCNTKSSFDAMCRIHPCTIVNRRPFVYFFE